jgi:4-amino-4-deoxy-L-arabinose transferase-like glycosyltransferase
MPKRLRHRGIHYLVLTAVWAAVSLPNLGAPGLWDIDEGNNAEAAYEMRESGLVVVPTFNYQLRVDKPALLYWLQMAAYSICGVNEFAARLPSALAALAAVLITYELGRQSFGSAAGLFAGGMLACAVLFCASARFANPDALLDAFTALELFLFWRGYRRGGPLPFAAIGAVAGLAMMAKGPVGLVLPGAVGVLFLAWQREWRLLFDRRFGLGVLTLLLVSAPWYTWVGLETKGEWIKGFFWTHNVHRVTGVMENHGGQFYYYVVVLLIGFAPWSVFFGPAYFGIRADLARPTKLRARDATRFLLCWVGVYLIAFTIVRTKLPNYILPVYPAVALLTARTLDQWRRNSLPVPRAMLLASLAFLALVGVGIAAGSLIASGAIRGGVPAHRQLPDLAMYSAFGLVPIAGALVGLICLRRESRAGLISAVAVCGIVLTAGLAGAGPVAVDRYKAPRPLAAALPADQQLRDVRIGAFEYFQPSLVFYCQREVARLDNEDAARQLLQQPIPAYLFVPATVWREMSAKTNGRELARHHDLYDGRDIVLVTNELDR